MPDDDVAKALQDALTCVSASGCRSMRVSAGWPSSPPSPRTAPTGAICRSRWRPSSSGCCAPARCRRRRRATCSRATSWSCDDAAIRAAIAAKIPDNPWIGTAPAFLVFLANGRRLPLISNLRGKPFPNDHLDLFFNAVSNCSIVLATFIRAAEAVGLGCCPISAIRDHGAFVSELLRLPERVVPVAGMCVGWPSERGYISPRLGLEATVHIDHYSERDLAADIDAYDRRRNEGRPPWKQRKPERWGEASFYGWSEDKARQYAEPLRADFGAFVRKKGFNLD